MSRIVQKMIFQKKKKHQKKNLYCISQLHLQHHTFPKYDYTRNHEFLGSNKLYFRKIHISEKNGFIYFSIYKDTEYTVIPLKRIPASNISFV